MFCKYCGKQIDTGTMRCRACGRPVGPLAGGTGFWDLNGGVAPVEEPENEQALEVLKQQVEELRTQISALQPPKKNALPLVAALLAAAGLGLGVYSYLQMSALSVRLEEQTAALTVQQEQFSQLERRLEEEKRPQIETEPVEIAGHPTDEEIILAQAEEKCVFTARVIGGYMPYTARWEKQDPNTGEFYPIVSGEEGYRTVEDKGSYQLWLSDAKEQHLGVYRFSVSDQKGDTAESRTVVLREKGAAAPAGGESPEDGENG